MARCPQCNMEVTDFSHHSHDSAANYVPWPLLLIAKLVRKLKRQPEPMSVLDRNKRPPTGYPY